MGQVLLFSITAAFNPTLLAAVTLMLVLDNPKRLLLGYLLGALMTSVTLGLIIVFVVSGGSSGTTSSAQNTVNPIFDLVLGGVLLGAAFIVGTQRDTRRRARSARKKAAAADKPPPKWKQALSGGSARTTFVVGALLTLPGASYLAGLHDIVQQDLSTTGSVLAVLGFNIVMLALLEVPLIGYTFAPEKTAVTVKRFSEALSRNGGKIGITVATVLGVALVVRGILSLLT